MPPQQKYPIALEPAQREQLTQLLSGGAAPARVLTRARLLLKADQSEAGPSWSNPQIAAALEVSSLTVTRVRKRFREGGLDRALYHAEPVHRKERQLDGKQEALLFALACSAPPAGRRRWTLRLLADRMVALEYVDTVSHETVRQALKRGRLSLG